MIEYQNEELLDAARDIAKIYNAVSAKSKLPCLAATVQEALEVAKKAEVKGVEIPKNFSAAAYLDHYTPEIFARMLRLSSNGMLLTVDANRALLTLKYRRYGTVAARMAKVVHDEYAGARAAGVTGVLDLKTVSEIIDWLAVGHTYKLGYSKGRVQIKPIPSEFRAEVESCLRFNEHQDWLEIDMGAHLVLPERFAEIDVVLTARKSVASQLTCKLPEWFEVKVDWLEVWRNQVEDCAAGIVALFNFAIQAGNQELLTAADLPSVLGILIKGAAGTGEAWNVSYSINPPNKEMRKALSECLKFTGQALFF